MKNNNKKAKLKWCNIMITISMIYYTLYIVYNISNLLDIISYILYVLCAITLIAIKEDIRKEEKRERF